LNVGHELISKTLLTGNVVPLIDTGFTLPWMRGNGSGSEVIFADIDRQAYLWILNHWSKHHTTPSIDIFREHYPEEVFLISNSVSSVEELIDVALEKVNSYLMSEIIGKAIDLHDSGNVERAVAYLQAESMRIGTSLRVKSDRADNLGDVEFDLEEFISREITPGVPMGLYPIDDAFYGFQPSQLITFLGRQKAGKTTIMLNSALKAWEEGYDVLFFSVEMDVELLRQRLYSLGAHVSPSRFRRGHLRDNDKQKVRAFHKEMSEDTDVNFYISKKKSMITVDDILTEIRLYRPHVVYIDGFNFMLDRETKKLTQNWEAHENVAAELKTMALSEGITVVVSAQVQEKQYHAKHGIEPSTIMGGTGLLRASDLVIGLDKDKAYHTISCVLSRYEYFDNVVLEIDWDTMDFHILEGIKIDYGETGI
jgi:KaiC/GvpD/RAD55 family RecA-like ATPase